VVQIRTTFCTPKRVCSQFPFPRLGFGASTGSGASRLAAPTRRQNDADRAGSPLIVAASSTTTFLFHANYSSQAWEMGQSRFGVQKVSNGIVPWIQALIGGIVKRGSLCQSRTIRIYCGRSVGKLISPQEVQTHLIMIFPFSSAITRISKTLPSLDLETLLIKESRVAFELKVLSLYSQYLSFSRS
jgi:hypothetical protein